MCPHNGSLSALDESQLLLELTREVTSTLDLQDVLDKSLDALGRLITFEGGSIQLAEDGFLSIAAARPTPPPEAYGFRIPISQGVGGEIVQTGEAIYIPDITEDARVHPEGMKKATAPGIRSWFGAPIIGAGDVIGVVQIDSVETDAFDPEARSLMLAFVPTIASAVQNARVYYKELESLRRLHEAERIKSDFLSVVSHELRTPLTSVLGFALTIAGHADRLGPEKVKEFGERIVHGGRRLEQLIEGLLDISRMERGWTPPQLSLLNLEEAMPLIAKSFASEGGCRVDIEMELDLPEVMTDKESLQQVLGHLLSNATKFSEGRSVVLGAKRLDDGVELYVRDNGKGIAENQIPRIFERFYQIEAGETRRTGGLGIGLYLVRMLTDRMGSSVRVESEPGRGSTFYIKLPE